MNSAGASSWGAVCALRGHCDDVYDLCWSPHGDSLFSGGVDGSTIVWNIGKAKPAQIVREHEHYVQGVAWDPADQYIVSVSLDRTSRIYSATGASKLGKAKKGKDQSSGIGLDHNAVQREFACHTVLAKRTASFREAIASTTRQVHLFQDDSVNHFYRRPTWSPDGSFLLLPCGQHYPNQPPPAGASVPTTLVFSRDNLSTPYAQLPSPDKAVIAIRCCPTLFERRNSPATAGNELMPGLPYRVLWAVATLSSIAVYDSSEPQPLLIASNLHYESLTDVAWIPDSTGLIASSIDGYCVLLRFRPGILGQPLSADKLPVCMRKDKEGAAPQQPHSTSATTATVPAKSFEMPVRRIVPEPAGESGQPAARSVASVCTDTDGSVALARSVPPDPSPAAGPAAAGITAAVPVPKKARRIAPVML